jgi:hypothetical protein
MSNLGEFLFFRRDRVDLDAYLHHRADVTVRAIVDGIPEAQFATQTDEELMEQVLGRARVVPLDVSFERARPSVQEIPLDVNTVFGERLRVKGLRATKAIPFAGDPNLWHLLTNPHDSNPPHGIVQGMNVIVGVDVREQDTDQAASYINDAIAKMKTYLGRQAAQIEAFNAALPTRIAPAVQQRRARLGNAASLLSKLS